MKLAKWSGATGVTLNLHQKETLDGSYVPVQMKRIMIVGQPGSGKSYLARELGRILNLPVIHIDHIHWQSGWVERPGEEKDRLCAEVHSRDKWIFEGGRSPTWPERLDRADTLIWLDFPLLIRAWRVCWRTLRYYRQTRPDLPAGCPERFNWEFTRWIWDTRKTNRSRIAQLYDSAPSGKAKVRLCNRKQVRTFVAGLLATTIATGKKQ